MVSSFLGMTLQGCNNELRKGRMRRMFEQLERFIEDNSEEILITGGCGILF